MTLRLFAIGDYFIRRFRFQPVAGQPDAYVARTYDPAAVEAARAEKREPTLAEVYPPDAEPFEVDEASQEGRRLAKRVLTERCLEPADQATAALCGVDFWRSKKAAAGKQQRSNPTTSDTALGSSGAQELS